MDTGTEGGRDRETLGQRDEGEGIEGGRGRAQETERERDKEGEREGRKRGKQWMGRIERRRKEGRKAEW